MPWIRSDQEEEEGSGHGRRHREIIAWLSENSNLQLLNFELGMSKFEVLRSNFDVLIKNN